MFKLVDFLSAQKGKKEKAKGRGRVKELTESPKSISFSNSEKEEIKNTVRTLNRETSMILKKTLKDLNLSDLAKEIELPEESESEDNYGTFRPQGLSSSYDTFRPSSRDDDDDDNQYGTFRPQNMKDDDDDDDDEGSYGTFRIGNSTDPESKPKRREEHKPTRSCTDPTGDLTGIAPGLGNLFREPESWEKHILALEKGEWTEGMGQNGAFKRWKKERPSMPSVYLRESSGD